MKRALSTTIIFLLVLQFFSTKIYCQTVLRLGTATKGGNYFSLGESIKLVCQNYIDIEVVETQGSVDNIYKLQNGEIDIALVQNDIAFFADNGVSPFVDHVKGLEGIMTFYPEPIYFVTNMPAIHHLEQVRNLAVNVGPLRSGLYADAKIILKSLGLWNSIQKIEYEPSDVVDALSSNQLQAAFMNDLTEGSLSLIKENKLFVIPFSDNLVVRLIRTYPYFKEFHTKVFNDDIVTVAVKPILLCKKDLDSQIIYNLTKVLYSNFSELRFPGGIIPNKKHSEYYSMPLGSWHKGARDYYLEIGTMESQFYLRMFWSLLILVVGLVAIIIMFNILIFSSSKNLRIVSTHSRFLRLIKSLNMTIIRHKYLTVIIFMLTAYLTDIVIIQNLEHDWAIKHNVVSSFDQRSFVENLLWIFVFGASGYHDNLFPQSPLGKFFATLIPLVGIGSFIAILGMFTGDHIKKKILEARGASTKMIKDHIIICGWNDNVPFLVNNLLHENILHKKPILILANIKEELPLEVFGLDSSMVGYVRGEATSKKDLMRANLKDADIAIFVTDADSSDPDAKNILKILTVEKYCMQLERENKRRNRRNIYTIAEIRDADNFEAAEDAFVDEIISFGHVSSKILVQSVLNPGVSTFLNNILTYNEFNDIYSIRIKEGSQLMGRTFDQLLRRLRDYQILLMSINIGYGLQKKELRKVEEEFGLGRSVLTNPIHEREINYTTRAGDILIVLAQKEQSVDNAVKRINKSRESWYVRLDSG